MDRHFIHFETPELATVVTDAAPPPGPEEVLIAVDHAGINRADLLQRLGLYPPPEDASPIPGLEVAGQIVAVGEQCTALQVGDRVCALTHGGGYASHAIAREDHCLALPDSLSTEQGAALPEALASAGIEKQSVRYFRLFPSHPAFEPLFGIERALARSRIAPLYSHYNFVGRKTVGTASSG